MTALLPLAVAASLLLAACAPPPGHPAVTLPDGPPPPPPDLAPVGSQPPIAPEAPAPPPAPAAPPAAPAPRPATAPLRLVIPSIGVDTPLVRLGLNPDGSMEVPRDFDLAGWYAYSPHPGDTGPAVIAGHIDSRAGPAVFARLSRLAPGQRIEVTRADGRVAMFVVDRLERHAKDAFPTDAVYGNTAGPELRLITCGGRFDPRAGHYQDNVIVFAHAV